MTVGYRTLAVIPARGGSKGVPRKNLSELGGEPLMAFTARAVAAATRIDRTIVSTDDDEIAGLACSLGLEVPFKRPAGLAQDETHMRPVMLHALDWAEADRDEAYDVIVCLDITAPFKLGRDIDACVEAIESGARSAETVCEAEINPYFNGMVIDDRGWGRPLFDEYFTLSARQEAPIVYRENAIVQAVHTGVLRGGQWPVSGRHKMIVVPQERSIMIDSELDFEIARVLLSRFHVNRPS